MVPTYTLNVLHPKRLIYYRDSFLVKGGFGWVFFTSEIIMKRDEKNRFGWQNYNIFYFIVKEHLWKTPDLGPINHHLRVEMAIIKSHQDLFPVIFPGQSNPLHGLLLPQRRECKSPCNHSHKPPWHWKPWRTREIKKRRQFSYILPYFSVGSRADGSSHSDVLTSTPTHLIALTNSRASYLLFFNSVDWISKWTYRLIYKTNLSTSIIESQRLRS